MQLPIGYQDFKKLRESNCYYVDKTALLYAFIDQGCYYALARPKGFGKTLLLSTLKYIFEGEKELFKGLDIENKWDWSKKNPVVTLSFDGPFNSSEELEANIEAQIVALNKKYGVEDKKSHYSTLSFRFLNILIHLKKETGRRAVVLVDDHDKPFLDVMDDPKLAQSHREALHGFYGILKQYSEYVEFIFFVGRTVFTQLGIFSGFNILNDVTLFSRCSTICGFTDQELDTVFGEEIKGFDREEIRHWYYGYSWSGEEKVYNPYSVLKLMQKKEFGPWWYEDSKDKSFFERLDTLQWLRTDMDDLYGDSSFAMFEVDRLCVSAWLFQAGYLVPVKERQDSSGADYILGLPNYEVRSSLRADFLQYLSTDVDKTKKDAKVLVEMLGKSDFTGFAKKLQSFLSTISEHCYLSDKSNRNAIQYNLAVVYSGYLPTALHAIEADFEVKRLDYRKAVFFNYPHQVVALVIKVVRGNEDDNRDEDAIMKGEREILKTEGEENFQDSDKPVHLLHAVFGEKGYIGLAHQEVTPSIAT
ncbi:MAG: AAA family ATPase [Proteobacteria bacterium]|nr:AAA family ATPase [Pseudomonadota bacterium]